MDKRYRLVLDLTNRMHEYFDETEFNSFEEAVSVAKYLAVNGYQFGEQCIGVRKIKVVEEYVRITVKGKYYDEELEKILSIPPVQ